MLSPVPGTEWAFKTVPPIKAALSGKQNVCVPQCLRDLLHCWASFPGECGCLSVPCRSLGEEAALCAGQVGSPLCLALPGGSHLLSSPLFLPLPLPTF